MENGIKGRVVLHFLVNKNGKISEIEIINKIDPDPDKEAVRMIRRMSNWIPGKSHNKTLNVYITLPVLFTLE